METVRLTQYSKAAGCGCKIAPAVLQEILKTDHQFFDKNLIVGNGSNDDAAVYDLGDDRCLISTTDFFMPIVDSAFDFGKIAAANALSDVYAMGGSPLLAIAILGWPAEKLKPELASKVLDGAREQCEKAGIVLAGGHSIESSEPIFGLAVSGIVRRSELKRNDTAREGDIIFMTKSIGSGIYSTALKRGLLNENDYPVLLNSMTELNTTGSELAKLPYVTAMTDITGFGLLGHLLEMLGDKGISASIEKKRIRTFENLSSYISQFVFPDNTTRNFNSYESKTSGMTELDFLTFCDPQTSGGLLFTITSSQKENFNKFMKEKNIDAVEIGSIVEEKDKKVLFV